MWPAKHHTSSKTLKLTYNLWNELSFSSVLIVKKQKKPRAVIINEVSSNTLHRQRLSSLWYRDIKHTKFYDKELVYISSQATTWSLQIKLRHIWEGIVKMDLIVLYLSQRTKPAPDCHWTSTTSNPYIIIFANT